MNIAKNLLVLFAGLFAISDAANILGLFTSMSPSHVIVHMAVMKALIKQGHKVTVVTSVPLKEKNPEYKHLFIPPRDGLAEELEKRLAEMSSTKNPFTKFGHIATNLKEMANLQYDAIRSDKFQSLIKSEKFDMVFIGYFFNDYQIAVAAQLKIPVVLSWMGAPIGSVNTYVGNPTQGSYVPNMIVTNKQPMDFKNRLISFLADSIFYGLEEYGVYKYTQYYE